MTKKNYLGLVVLMFCFFNCRMITNVPTTADSNIIISEPEGFNSCYLRHQQPGASTDKISVVINLKTYIFNGQRLVPLGDPQVITVNPNTTPFPITMVAKLPNNGTAAAIEVTIQGVNCSECAGGMEAQRKLHSNVWLLL